ncbi:hypothetical protein BpHYR1_035035 [Brachionus plicatilis]|uniref:Uncharacterized protein n=1 Tax=Brachionus plicatilis TaxID=10195 RepID=A0A3M7SZ73_BRAPC|nr:hypothetical protein BpHYR1_035035 [Brachionus plicatilis]
MIAAVLSSQLSKKRRVLKRKNTEKKTNIEKKKTLVSKYRPKFSSMDKINLLKRYMHLLKVSMISFILSTIIHIGSVIGYYYFCLLLNPDDPGKKKFYSETTAQQGINIGGKIIGGGIQTNRHKSYLMHLVREYYKGMSKLFLLQFGLIYLLILTLFKFFPEREKLKEDTKKILGIDSENEDSMTKTQKTTKKRVLFKKNLIDKVSADEFEDINDEKEETDNDEKNLLECLSDEMKKEN